MQFSVFQNLFPKTSFCNVKKIRVIISTWWRQLKFLCFEIPIFSFFWSYVICQLELKSLWHWKIFIWVMGVLIWVVSLVMHIWSSILCFELWFCAVIWFKNWFSLASILSNYVKKRKWEGRIYVVLVRIHTNWNLWGFCVWRRILFECWIIFANQCIKS